MSSRRRRRRREADSDSDDPRPANPDKRFSRSTPSPPASADGRPKRPVFPSYTDVPDLAPKRRLLCEILSKNSSASVDAALDDAGVRVTVEDVEEVLKLSYAFPGPAVKFFRWAGAQIKHQHSPYAWNLIVDLLGKNCLFEGVWDAVKSMRSQQVLSLATFASIFSSYVAADRVSEAFSSFEAMDQYGVPRDVAALNSLLSAICRLSYTPRAWEFFQRAKMSIRPDADSYAIILEGCENEGDARAALDVFAEMVTTIGWDPVNVPAYDSFLTTVTKGPGGIGEAMNHLEIMRDSGCLPGMKFFKLAISKYFQLHDVRGAAQIWYMMAWKNGCIPQLSMCNKLIALHCHSNEADTAFKLLDEMIMYGLFPDAETYNLMLKYFVKGRKLREAVTVFNEMVKNECLPTHENCENAIKVLLDLGDVNMAAKVWRCMVMNKIKPMEETGNLLVLKLRDIDMLPEACKFAEDMAERGIKVHSSTLSKLKSSLSKLGKESLYDQILLKWKTH